MKIKFLIYTLCVCLIFFSGCKKPAPSPLEPSLPLPSVHECVDLGWDEVHGNCLESVTIYLRCLECGEIFDSKKVVIEHDFLTEVINPTCTSFGHVSEKCKNCDYLYEYDLDPLNHEHKEYQITRKATSTMYGLKQYVCNDCGVGFRKIPYSANGIADHGTLSVNGADLVDEHGNKFQLYGLSTHGLQWANRYVNYDTFDALKNAFGINVIRLSLYTSEGGYCTSTPSYKEFLYQKVVEGVKHCAKLDMYAIVDWHMVGADDDNDKNPMYYVDEAMEFFARISKELKDYNNVLYEIMNEPCGDTTWNDCKRYANLVIPKIRENTNAIVLVGNPRWSSDLTSCYNSPLVGYDNIMYTYHFYAASHTQQAAVSRAYNLGLPVFVSEHGGMESSGDGDLNLYQINKWYETLDTYNISYVAWNLSNTLGSASIIKAGSSSLVDFSDENLKEWGIFYKNITRKKAGLPDN